jgi:hypothetical protein
MQDNTKAHIALGTLVVASSVITLNVITDQTNQSRVNEEYL